MFQNLEQLFDHALIFHVQNLPVHEIWHHWLQRNETEAHRFAILLLEISKSSNYESFKTRIDDILYRIVFCCDKCSHRREFITKVIHENNQCVPKHLFQFL